jgi:tyrosyl-tRNA synthetase
MDVIFMHIIDEFLARGFLHQATNLEKITEIMAEKKISAYIGFDMTARSLHIGSLMQIMILRLLQKYGHKPIIIVGGATTKIGDPTGKDESRKMLSEEEIEQNIVGIKKTLSKFLKFGDGPSDAIMLNNDDWFAEVKYIDFLRNYGVHFSINRMITMDSVRLRLEREQHLTFLEFNYMLLQAYDFLHLNRHYNCILQIGGSDQWGNIITGVELVRRVDGKEVFGITTPLLTTSSGAKMGKSASGALWLDAEMVSPYEFYQYWRNIEDPDLMRFARLYTELSTKQLRDLEILADTQINEAKKILAYEVTKICHGEEAALLAAETARKVFEEGGTIGLPEYYLSMSDLGEGIKIYGLFNLAGLCNSKSEARKLIRGRGARMTDNIIEDEEMIITKSYFTSEGIKLSAGKKNHIIVKLLQE